MLLGLERVEPNGATGIVTFGRALSLPDLARSSPFRTNAGVLVAPTGHPWRPSPWVSNRTRLTYSPQMRSQRILWRPTAAAVMVAALASTGCTTGGSARSEQSGTPSLVVASDAAFPATAPILNTDCHQAPATTAPGHFGGGHIVGCAFTPPVTSTPAPDADFGVLDGHVRDDAGKPLPSLIDVIGPNLAVATGLDGSYGASFPPGEYIVEVVVNADVGYQCGRHAVTVATRHHTRLDITCTSPNR